jgi:hypothetical protein
MPSTSLSRLIPLCWLWMISLAIPLDRAWADSFLTKVLRVTGISVSPSQLKGPDEEGEAGDLWLVNIAQNTQAQLTRDGSYRSPVFAPGDAHILALRGEALVRLPKTGGTPERLHTVKGVTKIVGFDQTDQDQALILLKEDGGAAVGLLSLTSGHLIRLPYDRTSAEHQRLVTHLQEWERVYGETKLYVKGESKRTLAGAMEWTDVYFKRGETPPLNLSKCDGINCGQPSLSHDGGQVVYISADQR